MTTWRVRHDGVCRSCGAHLAAGTPAHWDRAARTLRCLGCADPEPAGVAVAPSAVDPGMAGRSARLEHERRVATRDAALEARWGSGLTGRVIKALSTEPQTTRAWAIGADGEERLAAKLAAIDGIRTLHDRCIPGSRANIDHIVVAASGVYVIDAKNHRGIVRVEGGGLLGRRPPRLTVDGRDRSAMVEGMARQLDAVARVVGTTSPAPPLSGVLCFLSADWPLLDRPPAFRDILLESPRSLARRLATPGPLEPAELAGLTERLATGLPPR